MFYFFYYFPLGLDVRPRRTPWATWMLIGACTAVFLLQQRLPQLFWYNWDALVFIPSGPSPSSLVLNAYMHGNWLHLISNMLTLAVFGPVLEDRLGARRFLWLYHLTNIAANLVQGAIVLAFIPSMANTGVLGASGAIAGLMGLFMIRLYFARLRIGYWAFMPLQAYTRCGIATVPAPFAIAVWFAIQLGMAALQREGAGAGVACGSHLGGVLAGVGLATILGLASDARSERALVQGRIYRDRALWFAAQGEFVEYVRRQPCDDIGHLELARTYRLTGHHAEADDAYRVACRLWAREKRFDRVEDIVEEAERGQGRFALEPEAQLQLAERRERGLNRGAAVRAYVRLADAWPQAPQAPVALFRAMCVSRRLGGAQSAELSARLRADYPHAAESSLAPIADRCEAAAA